MFGFSDTVQLTVNTSSSRPARTTVERSLAPWELDGAVNPTSNYSVQIRAHTAAPADEFSLFLDKALALAG